MAILIIILFAILAGIAVFLLFKLCVWALKKRIRSIGIFSIVGILCIGIFINDRYFTGMELIQSDVYPQLYLVKNRVANDEEVHRSIQKKVLEVINEQQSSESLTIKESEQYDFQFYEFTKGDWGAGGTAYFLDHEERVDGMMAELLAYYPNDLIAETSVQSCTDNSSNFMIVLHYFEKRRQIKTDTLFNFCGK